MELTDFTVRRLQGLLQRKEVSAVEATQAYLNKIEQKDAVTGAYLTVNRQALQEAAKVDEQRIKGETLPPLAGIPMALKDNICTKGMRTTCASKMLESFIPPYSAGAAERLQSARAVLLGKLNMDEFAMGSSTETSYFKITRNPHDSQRVPGGSSGGSAAAVAACEAAFALGSDTGGSIRQPASFCGVVGMKPTYGCVSRYGLVAFASSLDQIGPLTKNVEDSALVLNAIAGWDKRDATSVKREYGDFSAEIGRGVKGMRLALPKEFFAKGLSPQLKVAVLGAAERYRALGAEIIEVEMPALPGALPAYYILSSAEASSNLSRFDGVKYGYRAPDYENMEQLYQNTRSSGFGREVKRRILLGTFVLSAGYYDAYYKKALQVRTLIAKEFQRVFAGCDAVLSPAAPTTAYKIGEKTENPLEMYLDDMFTVPVNLAGLPALSLPCGYDTQGLPIGMQLIGPAFSEPALYRLGHAFEQDAAGEVRLPGNIHAGPEIKPERQGVYE